MEVTFLKALFWLRVGSESARPWHCQPRAAGGMGKIPQKKPSLIWKIVSLCVLPLTLCWFWNSVSKILLEQEEFKQAEGRAASDHFWDAEVWWQHRGCQGEAVITHPSALCGNEHLSNPQIIPQDLELWMSGSTTLLVGSSCLWCLHREEPVWSQENW